MQKVETQRFGEMFVKNMLIIYFYMVIIKKYKVKKTFFKKFWEISGKIVINFRKFPEIFRGKFPEISELTTLVITKHVRAMLKIIRRRCAVSAILVPFTNTTTCLLAYFEVTIL